MSPEAAMLALLLERGVCTQTGSFYVQDQRVVTMRCNDDRPTMPGVGKPYRVPGRDRG